MSHLTQPVVHFLRPDDPGIQGGPPLTAPLLSEELIAALYRDRRYEDAIVPREPRWRGMITEGTTV